MGAALRAGRAFARTQKTNLQLHRHSPCYSICQHSAVLEGTGHGHSCRHARPRRALGGRRAVAATLTPSPGRRPTAHVPDRNCFAAIVYMARTSTPWRLLPAQELGCGSLATAWRRLAEWARPGCSKQLHLDILDRLGEQGWLDWSRTSVDSASVRAKRGGTTLAQIRSIVESQGRKVHLVCEGRGLPLTAVVAAANVPDVGMLAAVVDDIPAVRTPSGRRRCRPGKLDADKGYDSASQPRLPAPAWDQVADRPAWRGVVGSAWATPLAGGAGAVVAELLPAAWGAVGSGLGTVVRVRPAGVCAGVLQPAVRRAPAALPTLLRVAHDGRARSCEPSRCHQAMTIMAASRGRARRRRWCW